MSRRAEGWKLRLPRAGGCWTVRFRRAGKRFEVSTGTKDKTMAVSVAARIYESHVGAPPAMLMPTLEPTKNAGVYAIQGAGGYIKIGWAGSIARRISELQTGHPEPLRLIAVLPGTPDLERELHRKLRAHRALGEWFYPHVQVFLLLQAAWACSVSDAACEGTPRKAVRAR